MKSPSAFLLALLSGSWAFGTLHSPQHNTTVSPVDEINTFKPRDPVGELAAQSLGLIQEQYAAGHRSGGQKCQLKDVTIRRDWDDFSPAQRTAYLDAVVCLMKKPSLLDQAQYPGTRTRYDDFVTVHINQTTRIHNTGNFLGWHRYFVYTYEQVLRDECGYTGYQPYWNWGTHADSLYETPIFDGSTTSFGGDGAFVKHNGSLVGSGLNPKGGGCVTSGPFKDIKVDLGPLQPTLDGFAASPSYAYNPHCLTRDLNTNASFWLEFPKIVSTIFDSPDIITFQNRIRGNYPAGIIGVHPAGHWVMAGDGADYYSSPTDAVFFLHHAMLDRVYWIWQTRNLTSRLTELAGTLTENNDPPSANATLLDRQNLGPLAGDTQLGDLLNTLGGPFCYVYL